MDICMCSYMMLETNQKLLLFNERVYSPSSSDHQSLLIQNPRSVKLFCHICLGTEIYSY